MSVIYLSARNVHGMLHRAAKLLQLVGVDVERRQSRNGWVLQAKATVVSEYAYPQERVVFWPQRDANPFFHLAEALWMLVGRNDVGVLARYAKNMLNYSDDGVTLHGAYGYRWRHLGLVDQLDVIVDRLKRSPDDRRCVLQMWDEAQDLGRVGRDVPCNLVCTFQRDLFGALNLVVFNRSNDVIWGAYGANAVHFSVLQEFVAARIGCPVGWYQQVSVNWHAYEQTLHLLEGVHADWEPDPYQAGVTYLPLAHPYGELAGSLAAEWTQCADAVLNAVQAGVPVRTPFTWLNRVHQLLLAHAAWRGPALARFEVASGLVRAIPDWEQWDWAVAALAWLERRQVRARAKGAV